MLSILQPFLWRLYKFNSRRKRVYRYDGLLIVLMPEIFHPGYLYSTKNLYQFAKGIDVQNKTVLELGAGSGMIALDCARRNATVYASDIQEKALQSMKESMTKNKLKLQLQLSDVFDGFSKELFDIIFINPPYYNKDPKHTLEYAFYCGAEFDFFTKLFSKLTMHIHLNSQVYMILADNCDCETIINISKQNSFKMNVVKKIKHLTEVNYIYRISKNEQVKLT